MLLPAAIVAVPAFTVSVSVGESPTVEEIFADPVNESTKAEIEAEDRALVELGEENPAIPKDPDVAAPSPDPAQATKWVEGIFDSVDFPGPGYRFENLWQGRLGGSYVRVYAGAYTADLSPGVVLVDLVDPDTFGHTFHGPFEAPVEGPLRIETEGGTVLTLSSAEGKSVTFDVATETFG
jgi:hypothetical protein